MRRYQPNFFRSAPARSASRIATGPRLSAALPAVLLLSALILSACNLSLAADVTPPPGYRPPAAAEGTRTTVSGPLYPPVAPDPANGEPIYVEKCAPCHGPQGLGDGAQADALSNRPAALGSADLARQSTPAQWYAMVTQGNMERMMPPFSSLSDRERWDVVAYSYSLSIPEKQIETGKAIYAAECSACHGEQGQGDGPQAVSLDSRPAAALASPEFMAGRSTASFYETISGGGEGPHRTYSETLSEEERWAVSDYLRWLAFAGAQGNPAASGETGVTPAPEASAQAPAGGTLAAASNPGPAETSTISGTAVAELPELGVVRGQVTNASGGDLPTGAQVTLHGFDQMELATTLTTTVGGAGDFVFENIEMPAGRAFLVTLEYQNATYGSDVATVEEGMSEITLPVTVYDTTTDTSALTIDRLHMFLEYLDEQTLRVIELYIVSNPTERTVVSPGEGQPVLTYSLPEGASNLQFQEGAIGERYIETAGGFGDTLAIRPGSGTYQVLYAYELPYDGKLQLTHPVQLPVSALVVLAPEGSLTIKGEGLQDAGIRAVENESYQMYNGSSLTAGQSLDMTITGKPGGGGFAALASGSTTELLIGAAVFGLVLVGAGVWMYRRSRLDEDEAQEEEEAQLPAAVREEDPDALMDAILALDDQYQAGELAEGPYRQRRAELKARLVELQGRGGQDQPAG